MRWACSGPTLRASGVTRDVRVDAPYGGYTQFPVKIVVDSAGDLAARFKVRMEEILESGRVIRAILDGLPEGELDREDAAADSRRARPSAASRRRAASCSTTSRATAPTSRSG